MQVIAAYQRTGGRPPVDDERLEIDADGTWRLWRTMGGARVGAFAGRLSADQRRRLAAALESTAASQGAALPARSGRDAAHERFSAGRRTLRIVAGQPVGSGWKALARLLWRWTDSLASVRGAEAALELELAPSGPVLVRRGSAELRTWPATLHVDVYARASSGVIVDRASRGPGSVSDAASGEALTTGSGWSLPLVLPRAIDAPAGGQLEVWAWLDVDGPDGTVRVRMVASRTA